MPRASAASERRSKPKSEPKTSTVNLRVTSDQLGLIDRAASVARKSRTAFMVDSASQHAIDVLLDQRLFALDDAQYDAFSRALEAPLPSSSGLRRLLASKSPWER